MEKLLKSFSFADEIKFHISRNCCLNRAEEEEEEKKSLKFIIQSEKP